MFKDNKYTKTYNQLIAKAVVRKWGKARGRERHHIIPESLGGPNSKENLVYLSCREHAICHWLLVKMTEGEAYNKMVYAFNGMNATNDLQDRYYSPIISRAYERNRIEQARIHSTTMKGRTPPNKGRKMSEEQKVLLRERAKANHASGKVYSAESQQKRLEKLKGYQHSEATKEKQRISQTGKVKGPQSEEHRKAISESIKGKPKKEGHANNVRAAVLGNVSINKNGIEKKVKRDVLNQFLSEGWSLGGRKRIKQS